MICSTIARQVSFIKHMTSSARRNMSSHVKSMDPIQFQTLLKNPDARSKYQIVDVRESIELNMASIQGEDIIHLPLSDANSWTQNVLLGKLLDPSKPTICLCHHGVRSMQVASFLGKITFLLYENIRGLNIISLFGMT